MLLYAMVELEKGKYVNKSPRSSNQNILNADLLGFELTS